MRSIAFFGIIQEHEICVIIIMNYDTLSTVTFEYQLINYYLLPIGNNTRSL